MITIIFWAVIGGFLGLLVGTLFTVGLGLDI